MPSAMVRTATPCCIDANEQGRVHSLSSYQAFAGQSKQLEKKKLHNSCRRPVGNCCMIPVMNPVSPNAPAPIVDEDKLGHALVSRGLLSSEDFQQFRKADKRQAGAGTLEETLQRLV